VLLIDAAFGGASQATDKTRAVKTVLERANQLRLPVFEIVWPGRFETDPELAASRYPESWVRVEKYTLDAFRGTSLMDELRERGITDVIVAGSFQELCAQSTAHSAATYDLRVHTGPALLRSVKDQPFVGWEAMPDAKVVADFRELPIFDDAFPESP
jgi:hypothetical protein